MRWFSRSRARALAEDARDVVACRVAVRAGDAAEEERLARVLVDRNPTDHAMLFDLALAAKRRRDWAEAAALNEGVRDDGGLDLDASRHD